MRPRLAPCPVKGHVGAQAALNMRSVRLNRTARPLRRDGFEVLHSRPLGLRRASEVCDKN